MCCVDVTVVGRLCCARLLGGVLRRLNLGISGGGGAGKGGGGEKKPIPNTKKEEAINTGWIIRSVGWGIYFFINFIVKFW